MTIGNGKPCKRCGTSEWYSCGNCKQCTITKARDRRDRDPESHKKSSREYKRNNREKCRERNRGYYRENAERIKRKSHEWYNGNKQTAYEASRRYKERNRQRCNGYSLNYTRRNPEARKVSVIKYYRGNKDKYRVAGQNRRARIRGNGGSFTQFEWEALCKKYNYRCCYPGCDRTDLHADHVIPICKGGTNDIGNIQPLCAHHNQTKASKAIDYRNAEMVERWVQPKLFC